MIGSHISKYNDRTLYLKAFSLLIGDSIFLKFTSSFIMNNLNSILKHYCIMAFSKCIHLLIDYE